MFQGIAILLHLGSDLPGTGPTPVLCICSASGLDECVGWIGGQPPPCDADTLQPRG